MPGVRKIATKYENGIIFKQCTRCKEFKPLDDFYTYNSHDAFLNKKPACKLCSHKYARENDNRRYIKNNISVEQYKKLYLDQDGKCLICQKFEETLSIDHDHKTNQVRGLLCRSCNMGIGIFNEDIDLFQKIIEYLKKPPIIF